MITAVDTNVLIDLLLPNEAFVRQSTMAVEQAATEGSLVICDVAYAELCAAFASQRECDAFIDDLAIVSSPLAGPPVSSPAGLGATTVLAVASVPASWPIF
jgi:hypothetical protein